MSAASAGGLIAISSANGLYLDGQMIAPGGAGARRRPPGAGAGHAGIQEQRDPGPGQGAARLRAVGQGDGGPAALDNPATAADKLAYGHATLGADQLEQGGFGALDLLSNGLLSFAGDVTLNLGQSCACSAGPSP